MERFRLCWQAVPGGRTECTSPTTEEIAKLRHRDQVRAFPAIRSWIVDEGRPNDEAVCREGA